MEKNVGGFDRRLRTLAGIGLLAYALRTKGIGRVVALLVGADLLFTAAIQRCPLNTLLGIEAPKPKEVTREPEQEVCAIRTRRGSEVVMIPIPCTD